MQKWKGEKKINVRKQEHAKSSGRSITFQGRAQSCARDDIAIYCTELFIDIIFIIFFNP